jgi:hypothetical protein
MAERLESGSGRDASPLDALGDAGNVLVLAPSIGASRSDACHRLLTGSPPASTNVLAVTFADTPAEWIDEWTEWAGEPPARGGVVAIGQAETRLEAPDWTVETVENPGDLTGIGVELSELLSGMAGAAGEDESVAVCFDSVTSLSQYADLQRTFRFLHVVTGRIKSAGASGHFHVDPEAHSDQDLATLKGLFDAIVEVRGDGELTVIR